MFGLAQKSNLRPDLGLLADQPGGPAIDQHRNSCAVEKARMRKLGAAPVGPRNRESTMQQIVRRGQALSLLCSQFSFGQGKVLTFAGLAFPPLSVHCLDSTSRQATPHQRLYEIRDRKATDKTQWVYFLVNWLNASPFQFVCCPMASCSCD